METDGYSEGTEYPMSYLKSVPLVKEELQCDFNITYSLLPAKQMWSGSIQSTCGMGLTGASQLFGVHARCWRGAWA